MPRNFDVPPFYRSSRISAIKQVRLQKDPRKKDLTPSLLDFGAFQLKLARHFGFCFGVENAIEIAYRALAENRDRRIFLLSEMIHNPQVNADLLSKGVKFLMNTSGEREIDFQTLRAEDIVIVPAFGTTVELQAELSAIGINPYYYDTTCPFVEKVWKRSADLGKGDFTVIVHGKRTHEETRATFSHSKLTSPTLVILNMDEAEKVIDFIKGRVTQDQFIAQFHASFSADFDPQRHLVKLGVVNQTTMLASETQAIAQRFRETMLELYGADQLQHHFADTRDTLCYATHENQSATQQLISSGADLALVVGGYNSSNTSHLVELCQEKMPTYYIKDAEEILGSDRIRHFDLHQWQVEESEHWLSGLEKHPLTLAITSGASCPDKTVDNVIERFAGLFQDAKPFDEVLAEFANA